ncbi:MAG TPA: HD family hydrolase [Candidatus Ozemobacteraceae bacterium]|nr:HD family hydrolase [Candidatus Ozemobacteraceae bacterium]
MKPEAFDALFHDLLNLKKLRRTGWALRGIRDGESLADHAFGVSILTLILVEFHPQLNREKAVRLALLHELGECRVGDIPFPALSYLKGKSEAERAAVSDLLEPLGERKPSLLAEYLEFEDNQTPEARFVKAVDKLEMLVTAAEYERTGYRSLTDFWENAVTFECLQEFPLLSELANRLRQLRTERLGSR